MWKTVVIHLIRVNPLWLLNFFSFRVFSCYARIFYNFFYVLRIYPMRVFFFKKITNCVFLTIFSTYCVFHAISVFLDNSHFSTFIY